MAFTMLNISSTNNSIAINDTSGSGNHYCPLDTTLTTSAKTAAYVILLLLTFLGNVLVVYIIRRNPMLRSTVDLLIVNICVSDLFIPLFTIPYRIKQVHVGYEWIGGDLGSILCKLTYFAMNVTIAVSILSMLAIAFERFRAVVYPTKPTLFTVSRCRRLIALIWVLAVITYCVYFYTFSTKEAGDKTYCVQRWYQDYERDLKAKKIYVTSLIVLLVAIPIVLLSVLYTAVVIFLHQQKSRMASHLGSEPLRRRAKQNRKITFMLITIVVVFALAYVPFGALLFLLLYNPRSLHKLCSYFFVSSFLLNIPSAVNPVIYFTFNDRYRQCFRQLLCSGATCHSCPGCVVSPGQVHGNKTCTVVMDSVNHATEMQEIG